MSHDDGCRIGNDLGGWCTCDPPPRCVTCGHRAHPGGPDTRWCSASPLPGVYCDCTTHTDYMAAAAVDAAAPHLTADLVRERDALAAEVERLRRGLESIARPTGDEPGSEAYARAVLDGADT